MVLNNLGEKVFRRVLFHSLIFKEKEREKIIFPLNFHSILKCINVSQGHQGVHKTLIAFRGSFNESSPKKPWKLSIHFVA